MRVTADTQLIDINPGGNAQVVLDVRNTGSIIDGVITRVIGLPPEGVTSKPALLPLFPDATGQVTLSVALPEWGVPIANLMITRPVVQSTRGRHCDRAPRPQSERKGSSSRPNDCHTTTKE